MSNPQFEVVLKGVLAGFDEAKAKADFAALFSLDAEKVDRLFSAKRTVLKSGIAEDVASKYVARLAGIGVEAVAEAIAVEPAAPELSLVPIESGKNEIEPSAVEQQAAQEPAQAYASSENFIRPQVKAESASSSYQSSSADASSQETVRYPFAFTGKGFEYFKIWIVNILLSIVTLGIYSAWAKVRNKQYFYGNTHIADSTFEYTAEPIKILKGRIIAFLLYVAIGASGHISPIFSIVVSLLFLAFLPWIIVASLRFNARHSSYRNISFRFNGTIGGALAAFIGWPILGVLSLGLLLPFAWKKQAAYVTNNHSYGAEPFSFDVHVKEYYKMLLILIGATVVFFIALAVLGGAAAASLFTLGKFNPAALMAFIPMMIAYFAFYVGLGAYVVVSLANIHWNNTQLQHHKFEANWSVFSYFKLLVVNTLGILFTLGLFVPFAKVRTAAYKAEHTALLVQGDLDGFIANKLEESNSLAEGVHDLFDIDISL
ncbi:YjgN family protein [Cellvibrio sp.]|uniref:YjgN family protein n=1 Tax=Cellvibrio sp. TaxID=1965322 RepID=UPI0039647BB2